MNTALQKKKAVVAEVADNLSSAQAAVLAEYRGLTVAQLTELRKDAHKSGVYLKVVKNTLARLAVKDTDFACLDEHLVGPIIFSASDDPVAVAAILGACAACDRADRPQHLDLLIPQGIRLEDGGRLHCCQGQQLEQVVLEHVA